MDGLPRRRPSLPQPGTTVIEFDADGNMHDSIVPGDITMPDSAVELQ